MDLTEIEKKLIQKLIPKLREVSYGEVRFTVFMQDNRPIRFEIDRLKESIKI